MSEAPAVKCAAIQSQPSCQGAIVPGCQYPASPVQCARSILPIGCQTLYGAMPLQFFSASVGQVCLCITALVCRYSTCASHFAYTSVPMPLCAPMPVPAFVCTMQCAYASARLLRCAVCRYQCQPLWHLRVCSVPMPGSVHSSHKSGLFCSAAVQPDIPCSQFCTGWGNLEFKV